MIRNLLLVSTAALLTACATTPQPAPLLAPPETEAAPAAPAAKNAELAALFEAYDKAELAQSPISKSYRAIKDKDYGRVDQYNDAAVAENRALDAQYLAQLHDAGFAAHACAGVVLRRALRRC